MLPRVVVLLLLGNISKYLYPPRMMDKNATVKAAPAIGEPGPPSFSFCVCAKDAGWLFQPETFLSDGPYLLAGKFMHK